MLDIIMLKAVGRDMVIVKPERLAEVPALGNFLSFRKVWRIWKSSPRPSETLSSEMKSPSEKRSKTDTVSRFILWNFITPELQSDEPSTSAEKH